MKIDSRTRVLLTGANGGIGSAIARALHARGAEVLLSGRRAAALEPLAKELGARVLVADLADPASVERLIEQAGDVDVLVQNAALPASGPLFEHTPEEIEAIVRVNLTSPIHTSRAFGISMAQRQRGSIVMISSVSGLIASPGASLYSATKFGLRGFALALRADLAPSGVGVTTIFPGFIRDAGMFHESGAKLPPGVGTRSPEDVARAVLTAIEKNPPEITVAALDQRIAATFGSLFPRVVDLATQHLPAARQLAAEVAAGQRRRAKDRTIGS